MKFSKVQWKIIAACMIIYTAAYLNRLNLAAALGGVIGGLGISTAKAGLLQTAFAVVYAAGQMVNGALVDRVNPVRHMQIGIVCSAVCNFLMGLCSNYYLLISLCLLNGAFQSMLWTPILRLLAMFFADQKSRERANIITSLTLVLGHLGAWAISGYLSGILNWRFSFITPAIIAIPAVLGGTLLFKGSVKLEQTPAKAVASSGAKAPRTSPRAAIGLFAASGFFLMLVCCILFGFVRDGIKTWTPTILGNLSQGDVMSATTFSLIIPLINAVGMLMAYWVQQHGRMRNRRLIAVLLLVGAVFCIPLMGNRSMLLAALMLGSCCACMAGLEPILTALVPIEYDRENMIGLTAGLIDSLIYIGSALAGVCAGLIFEHMGMDTLFVFWAGAAVIAAAASWISGAMLQKYRTSSKSEQA